MLFTNGDRGGNDIPIKNKRNLHALWDGSLGVSDSINVLSQKAKENITDTDRKIVGLETADSLDFEDWLNKSHENAKEFVYSKEILAVLAEKEKELDKNIDPFMLSEDYIEMAEAISTIWVIQAGYRLSRLLENLLQ